MIGQPLLNKDGTPGLVNGEPVWLNQIEDCECCDQAPCACPYSAAGVPGNDHGPGLVDVTLSGSAFVISMGCEPDLCTPPDPDPRSWEINQFTDGDCGWGGSGCVDGYQTAQGPNAAAIETGLDPVRCVWYVTITFSCFEGTEYHSITYIKGTGSGPGGTYDVDTVDPCITQYPAHVVVTEGPHYVEPNVWVGDFDAGEDVVSDGTYFNAGEDIAASGTFYDGGEV